MDRKFPRLVSLPDRTVPHSVNFGLKSEMVIELSSNGRATSDHECATRVHQRRCWEEVETSCRIEESSSKGSRRERIVVNQGKWSNSRPCQGGLLTCGAG